MPSNTSAEAVGVATTSFQNQLRKLGPTDTTRTLVPTTPASVAPATGVPSTSVVGSGSGPTDVYYNKVPTPVQMDMHVYGSGAAGQYFQWQVIGRKEVQDATAGTGTATLPKVLANGWGQLGARAGVAGMDVGTGSLYADRLTILNDYTPNQGFAVSSGLGSGIATLRGDMQGNHWFGVELVGGTGGVPTGQTGTGASALNGLWAAL